MPLSGGLAISAGSKGGGKLTLHQLGSTVDVEDVRRVHHGEHIEPVGHDERRHVDLFVDHELANLPQLGNGCRFQHRFETVPPLPRVVDANRPHIDALRQRRRRLHQARDQHHDSRAREQRHHRIPDGTPGTRRARQGEDNVTDALRGSVAKDRVPY
jgi:hypothetical protein